MCYKAFAKSLKGVSRCSQGFYKAFTTLFAKFSQCVFVNVLIMCFETFYNVFYYVSCNIFARFLQCVLQGAHMFFTRFLQGSNRVFTKFS